MKTVKRICEQCGAEFEIGEYRLKHVLAKYCSRECFHKASRTKIECTCEVCETVFLCQPSYIARGGGRFCSVECRGVAKSNRTKRECEWCGIEFLAKPSNLARGKDRFCSQNCHYASKRNRIERECETCGKAIFVKPSDDKLGRGKFCSEVCMGKAMSGKNSRLWKGGITPENCMIRSSADYRHWREFVYTRDNWTCQDCGQRGGRLHAHHIFPLAQFGEHRFEVWNGTTLCKPCHIKTHFGVEDMETTH